MEIRKTDGLLKLGSETSKNNPVKDSSMTGQRILYSITIYEETHPTIKKDYKK